MESLACHHDSLPNKLPSRKEIRKKKEKEIERWNREKQTCARQNENDQDRVTTYAGRIVALIKCGVIKSLFSDFNVSSFLIRHLRSEYSDVSLNIKSILY